MASAIPKHWAKKVAEELDLKKVRIDIVACLLFSLAFLAVRVLECQATNCRWVSSAYGSVVWMLHGLHTVHLLTDTFDTALFGVLMSTGPLEGKRFVDASENAGYWYFVVLGWLPIYAVIYWGARF